MATVVTLVLAACGGSEGWQSVGGGDTYGEWDAFVEVHEGKWTGCMRVDHVDGIEQDCTEPVDALIVFEGGPIRYGAVREGETATFAGERAVGGLMGKDLDLGYEFFVTANDEDNPVELAE